MNKSLLRREQFPVTEHLVYLNHAAVGPLSWAAWNAIDRHARDQRDYGAAHWDDWAEEAAALRRTAARMLGATAAEISILKNTSEGISFVANGTRWKAGDNVVTTAVEFPSNYIPWKRLEDRGVECRLIQPQNGVWTLADAEALIDARTRILAISSVAFHNGFRPDLVALGEMCAAKGVRFCVDAIQGMGMIPIDVRAAKISYLAADGHKWLLAPEGNAVFFVADEVREELEVLETGWMSVDLGHKMIGAPTELHGDGRRFEAGSLNTSGIYGLRASMELLLSIGIEEIESEVLRVAETLGRAVEELGFRVESPRPLRSGIVGVTPPPGVDSGRLARMVGKEEREGADLTRLLHRWLQMHDVICAPREGMLRLAPHFYNDDEDIERLCDILHEAL